MDKTFWTQFLEPSSGNNLKSKSKMEIRADKVIK